MTPSQEAREYPQLPEWSKRDDLGGLVPSEIREELRRYVDSDRKARQQDALTEAQIAAGWESTFSTRNPFCPCDLRSFTKAVRWAEHAIRAAIAKGEQSHE